MEQIPVWLFFAVSFLVVLVSIEAGYRLGHAVRRRSEDEKESPVGAIAGSILGLLAFMLAFTFGLVAERYDARKGLVREEANTIRTAYFRADFLPEADRAKAKTWMREYVDERIEAVQSGEIQRVQAAVAGAEVLQARLWDMAVANARLDMNSDVAALYIESLNDLAALHALLDIVQHRRDHLLVAQLARRHDWNIDFERRKAVASGQHGRRRKHEHEQDTRH